MSARFPLFVLLCVTGAAHAAPPPTPIGCHPCDVPVALLDLGDATRTKTAVDYLVDANLRARIDAAAGSTPVLTEVLGAQSVGTTLNRAGWRDHAPFSLRVVFEEGSSIRISVTSDRANGAYEAGSARTASGQAISSGPEEVEG